MSSCTSARFPTRTRRALVAAAVLSWLGGAPALALPEDADQPIHIQANSAEIDQNAQLVVYRGEVQVDQGTLRVIADEMTIEYEDQQVVRIIARGDPAKYQQQLEPGEGHVKADAQTIIYHTRAERLDLQGDAFLVQEGNEITGELIHYDIVAGRVDAQSGGDDRVRMILQPAARPR